MSFASASIAMQICLIRFIRFRFDSTRLTQKKSLAKEQFTIDIDTNHEIGVMKTTPKFSIFILAALGFYSFWSELLTIKVTPANVDSKATTKVVVSNDESKTHNLVSVPKTNNNESGTIILIHYHKTGSAFLRDFKRELKKLSHIHGIQVPDKTNKKAANLRRLYDRTTGCPKFAIHDEMILTNRKQLIVLPAPSFFAKIKKCHQMPSQESTKIVHMVRDVIDMALSNYLYHSQDPTPEMWVNKNFNPCFMDQTMMNYVLPVVNVSRTEIDKVQYMCNQYFMLNRNANQTKTRTFYNILRSLPAYDGLRFATAQFTISAKQESGGDLLRMPNNIIRLNEFTNNTLTVGMNQVVSNMRSSVLDIANFIFDGIIQNENSKLELSTTIADRMKNLYDGKRGSHVTQGILSAEDRKKLKAKLEKDIVLAPVLRKSTALVNGVLSVNENL